MNHLLLLFCFGALFSCFEAVPDADIQLLAVFYDSTNGDSWSNNNNWKNGDPCDNSWEGITCSGNQVTRLVLINNLLQGSLTELPSSLEYLDLNQNQLSGTIPDSIGNLSSLTRLYLHINQFIGAIPDSIGNLSNLDYLYLRNNQLSGTIPDAFENLSSLTRLYLNVNQLRGNIPASIGNLSSLKRLYLHDNKLTGPILDSIGSLSNLEHLYLHQNQLSSNIPASIGDLSSSNLERLYLHENQLSGTIPVSIGNLSSLKRLYFHDNQLSDSIPASIGSISSLENLYLHDNQFSGSIPDSVFENARTINVSNNPMLCGTLPETIPSPISDYTLDFTGNTFLAPVPSWCTTDCYGASFSNGFSAPSPAVTWYLYYNGCIRWNEIMLGCESSDTGTFTLQTGDSFQREIVMRTDVPLSDGEFNWIVYGIIPSGDSRIKYVPTGTADEFYSDTFQLALDVVNGDDNPCISL